MHSIFRDIARKGVIKSERIFGRYTWLWKCVLHLLILFRLTRYSYCSHSLEKGGPGPAAATLTSSCPVNFSGSSGAFQCHSCWRFWRACRAFPPLPSGLCFSATFRDCSFPRCPGSFWCFSLAVRLILRDLPAYQHWSSSFSAKSRLSDLITLLACPGHSGDKRRYRLVWDCGGSDRHPSCFRSTIWDSRGPNLWS